MRITADTLVWLRLNGDVLEAAPTDAPPQAIDARSRDQVHGCLACNEPAQVAYIADTDKGPRWLDLCMKHSREVRQVSEKSRRPLSPQ